MKPRKHAELIKAWAEGAEIQYWDKNLGYWVDSPRPMWADDSEYRVEPPTRSASIQEGILTLEDGTTVDLKAIQLTLNNAFQEHGDAEFAEGSNDLSKLTGVWQGPHGDWFPNAESGK